MLLDGKIIGNNLAKIRRVEFQMDSKTQFAKEILHLDRDYYNRLELKMLALRWLSTFLIY